MCCSLATLADVLVLRWGQILQVMLVWLADEAVLLTAAAIGELLTC